MELDDSVDATPRRVLSYGSYFSGIEAPLHALHALLAYSGVEIHHAFAVEQDAHCVRTMQANYQCDQLLQCDVWTLDPTQLPSVDVFVAGFPCQPYSSLGLQRGANDPRGDGWRPCVAYCRAQRPALVLLENVPDFERDAGGASLRTLETALRDECGYALVEHRVLNARQFASCQNRRRLFVVAVRDASAAALWHWPEAVAGVYTPFRELIEPDGDAPHKMFAEQSAIDYVQRRASGKGGGCGILDVDTADLARCLCAGHCHKPYNHMLRERDGRVRKPTAREALRLMGFSDEFHIVCSWFQMVRQAGNSMSVQVMRALLQRALMALSFVVDEQT